MPREGGCLVLVRLPVTTEQVDVLLGPGGVRIANRLQLHSGHAMARVRARGFIRVRSRTSDVPLGPDILKASLRDRLMQFMMRRCAPRSIFLTTCTEQQ